jgi:uncharacterized Zn-finger protein
MTKKITTISCAGDLESTSKHPIIYLKLDKNNHAFCPYCSKSFVLTKKNDKIFVAAYDPTKN